MNGNSSSKLNGASNGTVGYKKHKTTSDYSSILDKLKYTDLNPVTSYYKPILKTFGFDSNKVCYVQLFEFFLYFILKVLIFLA